MIQDLDIYRSAHVLIREHGDDAQIRAAQQVDAMLDKGDMDGRAVWIRVIAAIKPEFPRWIASLMIYDEDPFHHRGRKSMVQQITMGEVRLDGEKFGCPGWAPLPDENRVIWKRKKSVPTVAQCAYHNE